MLEAAAVPHLRPVRVMRGDIYFNLRNLKKTRKRQGRGCAGWRGLSQRVRSGGGEEDLLEAKLLISCVTGVRLCPVLFSWQPRGREREREGGREGEREREREKERERELSREFSCVAV
jgi:hypothetical protein